jgi:uncharacterized membrane protein HdeD (DUF308 family)
MIGILLHIQVQSPEKSQEPHINEKPALKHIALISSALFFIYGEKLYDYPMEPWVLMKYGENNLSLILLLFILMVVLNITGVIIAGTLSHRFSPHHILIASLLVYGGLMIVAPFMDLILFFTLFGIMQIFSGFILVNIISLMMKYSQKKVFYYQLMSCAVILANVIWIPLGTFLSTHLPTEFIIVIAGGLILCALIPIALLTILKD